MIRLPGRPHPPLKALQAPLKDGFAGNLQTVEVMQRVARARAALPFVRQCAIDIINAYGTESQDYVAEAFAIGDFIQKHVSYVRDATDIEQLTDPLTLLNNIAQGTARGDCDDMSLLAATLLLSIGHDPFFRAARFDPSYQSYQHIYVVDYVPIGPNHEKRIVLDCIVKNRRIGFEVSQFDGKEFRA